MLRSAVFALILVGCATFRPTVGEQLYLLDSTTVFVVETTATLLEQERICVKDARRIRDYAKVVSAASDSIRELWIDGNLEGANAQIRSARKLLADLEQAFAEATANSTDHSGLECERPLLPGAFGGAG